MHARYGDVCVICGHEAAREAGHVKALANAPAQALDPAGLRPMHGSNSPCSTCKGRNGKPRCCNQEQGTRDLDEMFKPSVRW